MLFSGFIEASNISKSATEVFDLLCKATSPLGYDKLGFFRLAVEPSDAPLPLEDGSTPILVSNYYDS